MKEVVKWSNGSDNKGSFPLLPTAFVVAKDVSISGDCIADKFASSSSTDSENAHIKVIIANGLRIAVLLSRSQAGRRQP